jgi:hypothetical protein
MHATVLDGDRRPPLSGVVSVEQIPGRVRSLCDERGAWPAHTATGLLGPAHFVLIVPPTFLWDQGLRRWPARDSYRRLPCQAAGLRRRRHSLIWDSLKNETFKPCMQMSRRTRQAALRPSTAETQRH